jgi:hypothetical protein
MMPGIFAVSYAALCSLVVLEGLLLRDVLRKSAALKLSLKARTRHRPKRLRGGTRVPDFTVSLMEGESLTSSDLAGQESILMFVNPHDGDVVSYEHLATAFHTMWHRVQGRFYVLCNGSEQECRGFARNAQLSRHIAMALDEGGEIARSFLIDTTPQAVELDEDLLINRYGGPEPGPDAGEPAREVFEVEVGDVAS